MNPILLTFLLLASFSLCTFITERKNPRLYAHYINAFSPVFFPANGKHIMRRLLEALDVSNLKDSYSKLPLNSMKGSPNLSPVIFEPMLFSMPLFYSIKGIEDMLKGAENVMEEASRMCFFVLKECKYSEADMAGDYLFIVSSIYLKSHPNFPVVPLVIKLKDAVNALQPTPRPSIKSVDVRGSSVLRMVKGREFTRKYLTDRHTFTNAYNETLYFVHIARMEDYRNRFIGFDPSPSISKQLNLPTESKMNEYLKSALDRSIPKVSTKGSEETFSFSQDAYTPLLSLQTYLERKAHVEHPGDDQLHLINMWCLYSTFMKDICRHISAGHSIDLLTVTKFEERLDQRFMGLNKMKKILKGQMWISLYALIRARMPIISASNLEEYVSKLPVWLRELRKKMIPEMLPRADAFLCEELNLVADLMNLDSQKRDDLILSARYIAET